MGTYPSYTVNDLSGFSGRAVAEYTNVDYVPTAILQSVLLFKIGTCRSEFPEGIEAEIAKMAILAMADAIYLAQAFQKVLSNPFSSETIGSYSYSKVAGAVAGGLPTGITWFDIAVSQISVCDLDIPTGGGLEVFEHDARFVPGTGGNIRMLAPQDIDNLRRFGYDPAPGYVAGGSNMSGGSFEEPSSDVFDGGTF